ncbi:inhibitor of cysteine peptidase [Xanthomonas sacchari]|uniref:protease inhibitor I42 family protein n=1 Tax=Xanthomonas sacchari TaxID=56458 RepID=UPI00277F9F01|nr:protease inhibitor I42 family protein [Xanthomonas sacchari]MDQ1092095.1 inhibitor of cysteine peptidase [Xanthomonas sacchari]
MRHSFLLLLLSAGAAASLPAIAAEPPGNAAAAKADCARGAIALVNGNADQLSPKTCLAPGMKPFPLQRGQMFTITLSENGSTGSAWALRTLPAPLSLLDIEHAPGTNCASGQMGCPSTITYTFKAVGQGSGAIDLVYARHWEDHATDSRSIQVTVK